METSGKDDGIHAPPDGELHRGPFGLRGGSGGGAAGEAEGFRPGVGCTSGPDRGPPGPGRNSLSQPNP